MDGVEDERAEELSSISAIFPELVINPSQPFEASLDIPVNPTTPLDVIFTAVNSPPTPPPSEPNADDGPLQASTQHQLSYLPPLHLKVALPADYPVHKPPVVSLSADPSWLPRGTIDHLEKEVEVLWEDYGHVQTVFAYIDFLQQAAERALDLTSDGSSLKLDPYLRVPLLNFDATVRREKFENTTFECGVCLEPKKGAVCYQLIRCGHVFCKECLQDYYNNAIKEGDVGSVACLDPECGRDKNDRSRKPRTLPPGELLLIPIDRQVVQRYVDMKRKKKFDTDKSTVYCPRQWCQGPSCSNKVPKFEITRMETWEDDDNEPKPQVKSPKEPDNPAVDRLRICDDCSYAFCRTCLQGWHGEFVKCWEDAPLTEEELAEKLANRPMTEEDRLSYELILKSTSACPMCEAPIQKSLGCNHMTCNQCRCHFCYLCNEFLDPRNPYPHFGQKGTPCYQKLFELVEGDNGDENAQALRVGGPRHYEIIALLLAADREAEAEAPADAEQNGENTQADGSALA